MSWLYRARRAVFMAPGVGAVTDNDEVKTTIRITRGLLRSAKVWAAQHDSSFNGAVIEALSRLTKGDAR